MKTITGVCAAVLSMVVAAAEIRGPFPILSVPYHEDGALDLETVVKEAQFVADAGVGGFIWCQSNDAVDLLTPDETNPEARRVMAEWPAERVLFGSDYFWRDAAHVAEWVRDCRPDAADREKIFHLNAERLLGL